LFDSLDEGRRGRMNSLFGKDFFTLSKGQKKRGKALTCASCGLFQHVKSPRMEPYGRFKKGILNVGEAPGKFEDLKGKPWQGKAGRTLLRMYRELGIDLFEDCLNINAINCRPTDEKGNNRTPSSKEIACCRSKVVKVIREYKPKLIILLGTIAITSVIGERWKKDLGTITKWRGWTIPDRDLKAWVCPVFHPSFVMRRESDEVFTIWRQDLKRAFSMLDEPFPEIEDEKRYIHLLNSPEELPPAPDIIAFDFETTGIKPYAKEQKIICASVAYSGKESYCFMMPEDLSQAKKFLNILRNPKIKKIAWNMKYENMWAKEKLGVDVQNWYFDPMIASHILDNRAGVNSLKFQTYVRFGVVDYDSEISSFLKSTNQKSGNSSNKIEELLKKPGGKRKLMTYCALDSLYTFRLAEIFMREIGW